MVMINEAKDGLKNTLRTNDAIREEECVRAVEDVITLSSYDNSDSETSNTSYEPATSSNKASTFQAEHSTDNEETPFKKNHPRPWTSKKEFLETIKKLYFKRGGDANYEHLYILPSKWIDLLKFENIGDEIYGNLQNSYCTPLEFFVEENFDNWHPKIHGPRNYLQSFYLAAHIQKCGGKTHYPYADI